jgi:hypothetical protein
MNEQKGENRGALLRSKGQPKTPACYLIVVNDVTSDSQVTKAKEIVEFLLGKGIWIFHDLAPHMKKFVLADRLIIYTAGSSRTFVAEVRVASEVLPLDGKLKQEVATLGLTWFTKYVRVTQIHFLNPPRPIQNLLPRLGFVTDKKNYGLFLRQGVRKLDSRDVRVILGKS